MAANGSFDFFSDDSPTPTLLPSTTTSAWVGPDPAFPLVAGQHTMPLLAEQRDVNRVQSWQASQLSPQSSPMLDVVAVEARTARESAQ